MSDHPDTAPPASPRAPWAPYAVAVATVAIAGWLAFATIPDASSSGIIEEGIGTADTVRITGILVGVPTLLVVLVDGPVLVRRRGRIAAVLHWGLGLGLALWSGLMVFTVGLMACDGSCRSVPEGPVRAAAGVASLTLAIGGALVGSLARRPNRS